MSNKETKTAKAVEVVQEQGDKKKKSKWLLLLLLLLLLICIGIGFCAKSTVSAGELKRRLKADGTDTIELNGDVKVKEELVVIGEKILTGNGRIILASELDGEWPEGKGKTSSWGMGCTALEAEDTSGMTAVLTVSDGATLTVKGAAKVDAASKANAIHVENGGELVVDGKAAVKNGRYANIVVNEKATAGIVGGKVQDAQSYGVINNGTLEISGGTLSGAEAGAVVYTTGTATQSGGTIEKAGVHNVYVAEGEFTMTGGKNDSASKDGVLVQDGAKAEIEDGDITNCIHGLCNSGEMIAGAITLEECGIMNYKTGVLTLNKTTVDTAAVYCLANNGGKVKANQFTAKKCDTCAIYNFSGDMDLTDLTISGSRDGNIANGGGNMTVNGAKLEKCRDKSVVVANGKAVFNDVTLAGTSREKYGVYVYGGELYMTDGTLYDISSTAFKVDTGGYVEVKDVSMKDVAQIGFRADGGKIVAENVTMENLGSHAIYNMEGDITITKATINGVEKNMLQQKGGTTVLNELTADKIGNHGAYIDLGKVTITESTIKNMQGNGIYLVKNDNEAILKNVVLDGVQKQGVNNASKLTIDGLTVRNAAQNGIFNKEAGTITAEKVVISDVDEHGINNYNTMTLKDAEISNTGKGSNGLQNKGTLTIEKVSVKNSKNHGVYNTGTIKGSALEIKKVAQNGVYNNDGTFNMTEVIVNGAGEHGLNNGASMTVSNVTVKNTGAEKNSIQNAGTLTVTTAILTGSKNHGVYNTGTISGKDVTVKDAAKNGIYNAKGTVTVAGLTVEGVGEHGINNDATVKVSDVTIANTGKGKNSIQNAGIAKVTNATLKSSKNHGIYNTGTISGKNITVESPAGNGIYNAGGTVNAIEGLTVTNAGDQGVNNTGKFTTSNVKLSGTTKNGIYNNGGTATVNGVNISNTGEHGVSNAGTMTILNANISTPGAGKNGVQNSGTMTASGVTVKDSKNHGIYNNGTMNATGTLKVTNSEQNAIYNYNGEMTAQKVMIDTTSGHGVNNSGELKINELAVANAGDNGIQNSGTITVSGKADITDSGKHGVYNGDTFYGTNVNINNAGDLALSNGGDDMVIHGLATSGTASKAIYNSGYAELYTATIDGISVANSGAEYLIDNNGGVLDLTDVTIKNAKGTALHNRGKAATSVTNVVINTAGNYGTFVESGSSLSGNGLEINNITKGISGAEGMPIKNAGKITMLDHVTIGADDPEVTGSAAEVNTTLGNIVNNAIVNDATTASYSGYDLVVNNATAGCAIYNKGIVYVTDFAADKPKDGIVSRIDGWATLSGNVVLTNTSRNPMVTYGPEGKSYANGIELTSGSTMTIDGATNHAINNKGSFLAATDTDITVKNIIGKNVNAINNNTGTMTLGDVTVDGLQVEITMYNGTTINSNCGNGIQTSGLLELNGTATIKNIYTLPANNKTDNSNSSGVVVKNGGSITGTGSIKVIGNGTKEIGGKTYQGVFNGIFTTKCTIDIDGDISVDTVKNQGIYVADANAKVEARNITVSNVAGENGININKTSGVLNASGAINISNTGKRGISNTQGGDITAASITVNGTGKNSTDGEGISNGSGGIINVNGDVSITNAGTHGISMGGSTLNVYGNLNVANAGSVGIYNKGTIKVGYDANGNTKNANIIISTPGDNGVHIYDASGSVKVTGNIEVTDAENHGIFIQKDNSLVEAGGKITVSNPTSQGIYLADGQGKVAANSVEVTSPGLHGIYNRVSNGVAGTVDIETTVSVSELSGGSGIQNEGRFEAGTVTVSRNTASNRYAICNSAGTIIVSSISVENIAGVGIYLQNASSLTANTITINATGSQGMQVQQANTLTVGKLITTNINANGLRVYNTSGTPTVKVTEMIASNCAGYAVQAQKSIAAENMSVGKLWWLNCSSGMANGNGTVRIAENINALPAGFVVPTLPTE